MADNLPSLDLPCHSGHRRLFAPPRDRNTLVAAFLLATFLLAGILIAAPTARADITYICDTAGRLNYLVDGSGNVVTYIYDQDGDITSVTSTQPTGVAIYRVAPTREALHKSVDLGRMKLTGGWVGRCGDG